MPGGEGAGSAYNADSYTPSANSEVASDLGFIFVLYLAVDKLISQQATAGWNLGKTTHESLFEI
jgi:hypothetical protein